MCKKCNPNPCGCTSKNTSIRDLSSDSVVYDSNVNVACLGIQPGTPLTEALQTIGNAYCDLQSSVTGASAVITNIGTGQGIYASDTSAGAKQLKSISGSDSITVSPNSTTLTLSVDDSYIQNLIYDSQNENIVDFNTANPNSGSPVFTPNTPQLPDVIYHSTVNNSLWTWNGTTYGTYTAPQSTPFNLGATSNDAGGNKTAPITRTGSVGINVSNPLQTLHVGGTIRQTGSTSAIVKTNVSGDLINAVAGTDYLTPK